MSEHARILVVDDERIMRHSMAAWLREDGHEVHTAADGPEGVRLAREQSFDVGFFDLKLPGAMDGIATMAEVLVLQPELQAVMITAFATVDTAISAMKQGAQEYLVKPCNPRDISHLVQRLMRLRRLERENVQLRQRLSRQYTFHDIVSKSPRMDEVFSLVRSVASLPSTVLIQGESGTGKELVARAIHHEGAGPERPFVAVPCTALSDSLLESELFGHERGSFTGATAQRRGKLELAQGGTLFLDEVGDISPKMQRELLRFLQERTFYRVGGTLEQRVDVRVIAATHVDLLEAVSQGRFREDLYYRLAVVTVRLPPLRERREDIPLLARHLLRRLASELGRPVEDLDEEALALLMQHTWPGNVRELENALERALVTATDRELHARDLDLPCDRCARLDLRLGDISLAELETLAIEATLARTGGNVRQAALVLGIDRSTLYDKLKRLGLGPYREAAAR